MADLLGQCRAYLVARAGAETDSLIQIARRTGFGEVATLAERRPEQRGDEKRISFFIVHRHLKPSMMAGAIRSIRLSSEDHVRFAPVILFAEDGPFETYLNYVHMGFDDVITLPDKQPVLIQRLLSQLWAEQTYFETRDYFGPDRRRMEAPWDTDTRRSPNPHSHSRYTFVRMPGQGIQITKTELFAPSEVTNTMTMPKSLLPGASAMR